MTFIKHDPFVWPQGQQAAVCLTYDDGRPQHYRQVGPQLEAHGLRGTFYTDIRSDVRHHPEAWRHLAAKGHELGNHSIFHPCKSTPDRQWLAPHQDLSRYTAEQFKLELEVANFALSMIDGRRERSYGNNCHHTTLNIDGQAVPMDDVLREVVSAARGAKNDRIANPRQGINLMNVGTFGADFRTFAELQVEIEQAAAQGGWIIYTMHGVGPAEHRLHIVEAEHEKLVTWLGQNPDRFWVAPFIDVARYVRDYQA